MTALTKSNAQAYGVDFAGPIIDIIDDLTFWLYELRPAWSPERVWEHADSLAHAWAE